MKRIRTHISVKKCIFIIFFFNYYTQTITIKNIYQYIYIGICYD